MKYIGNKTRVLPFIESSLYNSKVKFNNKKVLDLFSGTGSVSSFFLKKNCEVISCDNMYYSICEQYRINYFREEPTFNELSDILNDCSLSGVLSYLNNLKGIKGYYFNNYAPSGFYNRQYFSDKNACKIDAIKKEINNWKNILNKEKYNYLLGILMCAADKISNTSGTYGAYLKIWRTMALKDIFLEKPEIIMSGSCIIEQSDVLDCTKKYRNLDIVYLDPPYNQRQYASNFHVLENIVMDDYPELSGKTGLRPYEQQKSDYCLKNKVLSSFKLLVETINSKYIVMSYSTEGLLKEKEIVDVLSTRGNVEVYKNNYRRFKTNAWTEENTGLQELLFICKIIDN